MAFFWEATPVKSREYRQEYRKEMSLQKAANLKKKVKEDVKRDLTPRGKRIKQELKQDFSSIESKKKTLYHRLSPSLKFNSNSLERVKALGSKYR